MSVTIDGSAGVTTNSGAVYNGIASGAAVPYTSFTTTTYNDFLNIPSWVKRITVMFNGISTSGTSIPIVQLGTSAGLQTSSYSGSAWTANTNNSINSNGLKVCGLMAATYTLNGIMTICLADTGTGLWVASIVGGQGDQASGFHGGGSKTLSATLTQLRITTFNGTDTFDAGSVNILYE